jgi:hypothetical protein
VSYLWIAIIALNRSAVLGEELIHLGPMDGQGTPYRRRET